MRAQMALKAPRSYAHLQQHRLPRPRGFKPIDLRKRGVMQVRRRAGSVAFRDAACKSPPPTWNAKISQYRAENTVIDSARRALSIGEVSAKKEPIRPGKLHFEEGALKRVGKSCKAQTVVSTPSKQFFPSLFLKTSLTTLLANALS